MTVPLGAAVYGKVFGTSQQFTILTDAQVFSVITHALKSSYHCQSHLRSEVGVFTISLLSTSPAGVTEDIDVRCPERETLIALDVTTTLGLSGFYSGFIADGGEHAVE